MLTSYLCFNSSAGRFEQNGHGMLLHLSYRVVVCVLLYKALWRCSASDTAKWSGRSSPSWDKCCSLLASFWCLGPYCEGWGGPASRSCPERKEVSASRRKTAWGLSPSLSLLLVHSFLKSSLCSQSWCLMCAKWCWLFIRECSRQCCCKTQAEISPEKHYSGVYLHFKEKSFIFLRWGTEGTGLLLYSVMLKIIMVLCLDVMAA